MAGPYVTQYLIRSERESIEDRRRKAEQDLQELQKRCKHPDAKKTPRGDTGNWCKADDAYWTDCRCSDCGRVWTEGYKDGYKR